MKENNKHLITITEEELKSLISEYVNNYLSSDKGNMLIEMAMERKAFKERVEHILPQIIENWCLIYYSRITNTNKKLINHWKSELDAHISSIISYQIKGNNSLQKRNKIILNLCNELDYNLTQTIAIIVRNKFLKEHLDVKSKEYFETCEQFTNYSDDLIHTLSQYGNVDEVDNYLAKL